MEDRNILKIKILLLIVACLLMCNIFTTSMHFVNYEKQKESGNERWKQVENRISEMEEKIDGRNH